MAFKLPPLPNNPITDVFVWRDWFYKVSQLLVQQASIAWSSIDFTGSNLQDIQTRQHNALQNLQGGIASQYYHLSLAQYNAVAAIPSFPIPFNQVTTTYGSFSNTADQLASADNTATVVALNTTDVANNTSLASNQITISTTGKYNIQFSLQFANTHSQAHNAWIWLRKNGTDIAGTGSKYDVPSTHGSSDGYLIAVANFFVSATAGDYFELVFAADQVKIVSPAQTGVYIEAYAASTSPFTMPSVPSSVVTVSQVA